MVITPSILWFCHRSHRLIILFLTFTGRLRKSLQTLFRPIQQAVCNNKAMIKINEHQQRLISNYDCHLIFYLCCLEVWPRWQILSFYYEYLPMPSISASQWLNFLITKIHINLLLHFWTITSSRLIYLLYDTEAPSLERIGSVYTIYRNENKNLNGFHYFIILVGV